MKFNILDNIKNRFADKRPYSNYFKNRSINRNSVTIKGKLKEDFKIKLDSKNTEILGDELDIYNNTFYRTIVYIPEAFYYGEVKDFEQSIIQIRNNFIHIPEKIILDYDIRVGDYIPIGLREIINVDQAISSNIPSYCHTFINRRNLKNNLGISVKEESSGLVFEVELKKDFTSIFDELLVKDKYNDNISCSFENFEKGSRVRIPSSSSEIKIKCKIGKSKLLLNYDRLDFMNNI